MFKQLDQFLYSSKSSQDCSASSFSQTFHNDKRNDKSEEDAKENDRPSVVIDRKLAKKYKAQYLAEKRGFQNTSLINIKECNKKYHAYKNGAQKRQIGFHLSLAQCIKLFNAKCYYCGLEARQNGSDHLSGIDRKDSDRSYSLENVVPCCSHCNISKGVMTVADFESMALHITLQTIKRRRIESQTLVEKEEMQSLDSLLVSFIYQDSQEQQEKKEEYKTLTALEEVSSTCTTEEEEEEENSQREEEELFLDSCKDEYILGLC